MEAVAQTLFQQFTNMVLTYPDIEINRIYNNFIQGLTEEQRTFVTNNYALFIKCGLAAQSASPEVQQALWS